jgi:hypothetical protein
VSTLTTSGVALQGGKVVDVDVLRKDFAVGKASDMGLDESKFCDIVASGLKGRIGVVEVAEVFVVKLAMLNVNGGEELKDHLALGL